MCMLCIFKGLFNEVVGPTLPDLKARIGVNYEEIARVLSARSAGLFLGSVSGGMLYDRFTRKRDLILAASLLISGTMILVAPWCPELWLLGVMFHLMGHGHGLLTTGKLTNCVTACISTQIYPYTCFWWGKMVRWQAVSESFVMDIYN